MKIPEFFKNISKKINNDLQLGFFTHHQKLFLGNMFLLNEIIVAALKLHQWTKDSGLFWLMIFLNFQ